MAETNKELLDELIRNRAEKALDPDLSEDERKTAYEDVMKAYDRSMKQEELEASREQAKMNRWIKWIEIIGVGIAVPVGLFFLKKSERKGLMRDVMYFEKNDRFSYTPGQSFASSFFRHKD